MHEHWYFFRNFLSNVAMTMAKTDLEIAATTSSGQHRAAALLRGHPGRARAHASELLQLRGEDEPLGDRPEGPAHAACATTTSRRSTLQVALTERRRADRQAGREPDPDLRAPLTVNGIAAGLRNTG